jgi:hypothetical protein
METNRSPPSENTQSNIQKLDFQKLDCLTFYRDESYNFMYSDVNKKNLKLLVVNLPN